jgi:nucleoid DNA-binding protein
MTHTELIEEVAELVGASYTEAHGFVQSFIDIVIARLDSEEEVKIRGLGTFKWAVVKGKKIPSWKRLGVTHLPGGKKLRFIPATKFKTRRPIMSDEDGMDKYAVVTEGDSDEKTASDDTAQICPICAEDLDNGGACPTHGTKPFEPGGQ